MKKSGAFPNVTKTIGLALLKSVLEEDSNFPATRCELIENQGWKVFDLTEEEHVHESTLPDVKYASFGGSGESFKTASITLEYRLSAYA